jgi:hypothetical protein
LYSSNAYQISQKTAEKTTPLVKTAFPPQDDEPEGGIYRNERALRENRPPHPDENPVRF